MIPNDSRMRIGELAVAAGTTVRTLRHYEQLGLVAPAPRSRGRQRRYGDDEVRRLYVVRALRDLGLSLGEVRRVLACEPIAIGDVLRAHRDRVDAELKRLRRLRASLDHACRAADRELAPGALLDTIEAMSHVSRRASENATRHDWRGLGKRLRACMDVGTSPSSMRVRPLARRARAWIDAFAGGDRRAQDALAHVRRVAPPERLAGWDPALFRYLDRALAALERSPRKER